jgi:hypothetical protein
LFGIVATGFKPKSQNMKGRASAQEIGDVHESINKLHLRQVLKMNLQANSNAIINQNMLGV